MRIEDRHEPGTARGRKGIELRKSLIINRLSQMILIGLLHAGFAAAPSPASAADPVTDFIVVADSLGRNDDDTALSAFVAEKAILVGAAVGELLDVAFQVEDDQPEAAAENVAFAARISALYEASGGTPVPAQLVERHRAWTAEERKAKRKAAALEDEAKQLRQTDPNRAVELLERAAATYRRIDDPRALAINRGTLGTAHWYREDWFAVEAAYDEALLARRAIEDRILEGRTLNGQGSARLQQGLYDEARRWYSYAAALREKTGDEVGLATSLTYAGTCEVNNGRLLEARRLFERALPVLERSGDPVRQIELFHAVGNLYAEMGRPGPAVDAYDRALALIDAAPEFEIGVRLDRAGALLLQRQLRATLASLAAIEEAAGAEGLDDETRYRLTTSRAGALTELGELDTAAEEWSLAADTAEHLGDPEMIARSLSNLARLELERLRPQRALALADSAAALARTLSDPSVHRIATLNAADALFQLGLYPQTLERIDESLETMGYQGETVELAILRASALARMGREEAARTAYREVARQYREAGRTELLWAPLMGMADTFERSRPDSAKIYYERTLQAFEDLRRAAGSGAMRTSFLATRRGSEYEAITHFFARRALGANDTEADALAFNTVERARARGLLQLLQQSFATGDDPELEALLDELYALGDPDPTDAEERRRIEGALARRWDSYLGDAAPWMTEASLMQSPAQVSASLEKDDLVLAYAVGDTASYLWAIDRDGHELIELPGRAELREHVIRLRDALQIPGFGDERLREESRGLFEILVEPAQKRLRGKKSVVLVPDDVLFELPFELLLTEQPRGKDWKKAPFFARKHQLSYAPSVSILLQLRDRPAAAASAHILAVADPDFSPLALRSGLSEELPPLPQTRKEVEVLRRLRADEVIDLVGQDATESAVRDALDRNRPRIIHLATHGLVDRDEPSLTSIALSRAQGDGTDGYLYTLEILALPLDTELVVLSACDTGRGKLERGEGTIGLVRSFLAAGTRRVVASLWPVADDSTAELMGEFYRQLLRNGKSVPEALNDARRELWRSDEFAHPYFWAAFVLTGSDGPLPPATRG